MLAAICAACTRDSSLSARDEATIRSALQLPAAAKLLSLTAEPASPGTFGREGLRLVASFALPSAEASRFATAAMTQGWRGLPLPDAAAGFKQPPTELPAPQRGVVFCRVGKWRTGNEFDWSVCEGEKAIDRYQTAVLDLDNATVSAVFKNYY